MGKLTFVLAHPDTVVPSTGWDTLGDKRFSKLTVENGPFIQRPERKLEQETSVRRPRGIKSLISCPS
jgi:hypothetical protein